MISRLQKIAFSADQLIFQKYKLDVSITKHVDCRYEFEATIFNQERLLYCTRDLSRDNCIKEFIKPK